MNIDYQALELLCIILIKLSSFVLLEIAMFLFSLGVATIFTPKNKFKTIADVSYFEKVHTEFVRYFFNTWIFINVLVVFLITVVKT